MAEQIPQSSTTSLVQPGFFGFIKSFLNKKAEDTFSDEEILALESGPVMPKPTVTINPSTIREEQCGDLDIACKTTKGISDSVDKITDVLGSAAFRIGLFILGAFIIFIFAKTFIEKKASGIA